MTYDPVRYWKEQGKQYFHDFKYTDAFLKQEKVLVEYLKQIEFKSVLELGCGFGRITRLLDQYFDIDYYEAIDISPDQLSYAKNYPYKNTVRFIESDIESFKVGWTFDLVLAVEVLMHQTPDKILGIINKMKSLSNKHVISIDYYGFGEKLEPHNFAHEYHDLYGEPINMRNMGKQCMFHWEKQD